MAERRFSGPISGTDITVNEEPSQGRQFLKILGQGVAGGIERASTRPERERKKEVEKMKYYSELRAFGYSPDEASDKVDEVFKGSFIERVLGKQQGFQRPKGISTAEAKAQREAEKTTAQTRKIQAETRKLEAQAKGVVGKDVFVVTEDGALKKIGRVGESAKVFKQSRSSQNFTATELQEIMASSRYTPEQKSAAQKMLNERLGVDDSEPQGVRMSKGGVTRLIDSRDVEKAKRLGWQSA